MNIDFNPNLSSRRSFLHYNEVQKQKYYNVVTIVSQNIRKIKILALVNVVPNSTTASFNILAPEFDI
jgi:hypothetical protein